MACMLSVDSFDSKQTGQFMYFWIGCYLVGSISGLLSALYSFTYYEFSHFTVIASSDRGPFSFCALFVSSLILLGLTVLISQLPGRRFLIMLLVLFKAFSLAFTFGLLYLLHFETQSFFSASALALHSFFVLPVFYFMARHCCCFQLLGRGRYWFRYRIGPILLAFLVLFLLFQLEVSIMSFFN